jgi:hypothetical protein
MSKTEREERMQLFKDFFAGAGKPKICDSCSYARRDRRGYKNPCKKGHDDSRIDKEFCEDHPNPEYHSKKSKP